MKKNNILHNGIPISVSLNPTLEAEHFEPPPSTDKKRLLIITGLAIVIAVFVSLVAKALVYLIDLFTNIFFFGKFSLEHASPSDNHLGLFVIAIPVMGGVIVGLMALYGSKAIRGHGIPEAMEQILTNKSKIRPAITYLKPLSSAISIGTGGPFGAEGPIIATGGALGSTLGQVMKISHHERKILLAAGATAGMSAIFGSPVAAIFLAIELLLFEFSPRSLIPVSLACVVGAAGHHFLFDAGPVFTMPPMALPGNNALALYCLLGLGIGLLAVLVTKAVYWVEDAFEKIPVHWMWWPAIGGLAVGVTGYFAPHTLGVGYENISAVLSGNMALRAVLSLCLLKFFSWAIALGSGTSGGTLAPLLTIGGATGALLGIALLHFFPGCGIVLPMAALIGMSAMFAGASRALLTSIIFALETTSCSNALLPLLGACIASYSVSFFLMRNTIMTEKIARRGVKTPHSYEPDILEKITLSEILNDDQTVLSEENSVQEVREWLGIETQPLPEHLVIVSDEGEFRGLLAVNTLLLTSSQPALLLRELVLKKPPVVNEDISLRSLVEIMAREGTDVLPVVSKENRNTVIGVISHREILPVYATSHDELRNLERHISLKRRGLKILLRGQKLVRRTKEKSKEE